MTTSPKIPLPLTILTGFLGAGKTTLLNHLLRGEHGMRIAVMVNDFGAVNIDAQMIVGIEGEEMVNLSNGCICCTIRGDLLRAAQALAARPDPPDYLLIEASGVSDPHAILMTFAASSARTTFRVDTVLTVVDVEQAVELHHAQQKLAGRVGDRLAGFLTSFFPSRQAQLYEHQISAADLVVLNKTDLLPSVDLSAVRAWVRKLSPRPACLKPCTGKSPCLWSLAVSGRCRRKFCLRTPPWTCMCIRPARNTNTLPTNTTMIMSTTTPWFLRPGTFPAPNRWTFICSGVCFAPYLTPSTAPRASFTWRITRPIVITCKLWGNASG